MCNFAASHNTHKDMEQLKVINFMDAVIGSYFTDDRECAHPNREHTLIYLCSDELEIIDHGRKTILHEGDCAFMRRDNQMTLQKRVKSGVPYRSVVLKFNRKFLREFYQTVDRKSLPKEARRDRRSLVVLPKERPDVKSLFLSVLPYLEADMKPADEIVKMKLTEGLYVLLATEKSLYASLFDFTEPWKIDLLEYMNENYMYELTMAELASFTGRSLATFKRDFKKISELSPQKWLIRRRLQAAHDMITTHKASVSDICYRVGFKNLSHFSKTYKDLYGVPPTVSMA